MEIKAAINIKMNSKENVNPNEADLGYTYVEEIINPTILTNMKPEDNGVIL